MNSKNLLIGLTAIMVILTAGVLGIGAQKNDELEIEFILVYEDGTEEVYKKDVFSGIKRLVGLVVFKLGDATETPIISFKVNTYLTVFWEGPKHTHTIAGYTYIRVDGTLSMGGDDGNGGYLISNPGTLVNGEKTLIQTIDFPTSRIDLYLDIPGDYEFTATVSPIVTLLFTNGDESEWVGEATGTMTFTYRDWEITDVQISFSTSYLSVVD